MDDLPARPAYILNLRWDVVAWNAAADKVFRYSAQAPAAATCCGCCSSIHACEVFVDWQAQAPRMLSSFRRSFASASDARHR